MKNISKILVVFCIVLLIWTTLLGANENISKKNIPAVPKLKIENVIKSARKAAAENFTGKTIAGLQLNEYFIDNVRYFSPSKSWLVNFQGKDYGFGQAFGIYISDQTGEMISIEGE